MDLCLLKRVRKAATFGLMTVLLVLFLKVMNWMPHVIEKESFRKYASIDMVRKTLHIDKIYMPSYLPEDLKIKWPPSEIYAQKEPFTMIIMHFQHRDSEDIALSIHQVDAGSGYTPEPRVRITRINRESSVMVKDREGTLAAATCEGETPCNLITWTEAGVSLTVVGKIPQRDLIRVARSMIPDS